MKYGRILKNLLIHFLIKKIIVLIEIALYNRNHKRKKNYTTMLIN